MSNLTKKKKAKLLASLIGMEERIAKRRIKSVRNTEKVQEWKKREGFAPARSVPRKKVPRA